MENLPNDWDNLQKSLGASVLQSRDWADVQAQMGRRSFFAWSNHWSYVGFERRGSGVRYLLLPYGPTASVEGTEALQSILELAKKESFDFVRIEPRGKISLPEIANVGASEVGEFDPKYTQVVDLTQSIEELRKDLNSGHRNLINGTARRELVIDQSDKDSDFEHFLDMLDDTSKRAKVKFHPHEYYKDVWKVMGARGSARLYIATHENQPVASALFYDYNGVRYYAHAGAFQQLNRKLNASVSLLWQAIIDAKDLGMTGFDMWGVAPGDDPKHKWAGITAFKKGFGGKTISHLGTFDVPINVRKYKLYKAYAKLRGRSL